jgi:hypothetical protein
MYKRAERHVQDVLKMVVPTLMHDMSDFLSIASAAKACRMRCQRHGFHCISVKQYTQPEEPAVDGDAKANRVHITAS